ncbi:MAG: hypothetical protein Ct9H90mP27_6590 [Gammaproteobacteria bacterium]|nr:MAG: hypothetical protein Ct9H90mP27_6590 [Gammaproteobacteria bacterium]
MLAFDELIKLENRDGLADAYSLLLLLLRIGLKY